MEAQARAAYEEAHYAEAEAALEKKHEEMSAAGEEIPEDDEVVVDMSGFEATPEMLEKQEEEHEELKRLLYVAATRAKEKLYVTIPQATSRTSKNPWWDGIQLFGDGKAQFS